MVSRTPGKTPSGFSSYSYEVTFGAGTLGINLQATRSGKGAYVDSFHRPSDNSILPAEQSRYIKLGDLVLEINGEDVSNIALSELPKVIERAKRPVTIKFERGNLEMEFSDVVRDPRKLPWFMQYIVEKYGIEEAVQEQAKLMLWLECEQFIENEINVPDGDYSDQAYMILKKFFRPDSTFSLLLHAPEKIRSSMLIALAEAESEETSSCLQSDPMEITDSGNRRGTPIPKSSRNRRSEGGYLVKSFLQHHLYRDAQRWAEEDMKSGSYRHFCSSKIGARMTGHLRYSPPFVKISLTELLGCDKKSVFLLLFLCQLKRHGILHCYELLKSRPEDNIEGGIPAIEEMVRIATACVHVLGLKEDRCGIEDLWMLTRLAELVPQQIEQPSSLTKLLLKNPVIRDTGYIESLQNDVSLSIPISDACRALARSSSLIVNEIRECLRELRTTILRELSTEIVPKFFASNEFEILLWELDAHKLYLLSQQKNLLTVKNTSSEEGDEEEGGGGGGGGGGEGRGEGRGGGGDEEDELVHSYNKFTTEGNYSYTNMKQKKIVESIGPAVPDGAVQRLLRKLSSTLPSTITMHRAPLDLMDTVQPEKEAWNDSPMGWLLLYDTEGGRLHSDSNIGNEKIRVLGALPLYAEKGHTTVPTTNISHYPIIPDGVVNFLLPNGRCVYEIKETLFGDHKQQQHQHHHQQHHHNSPPPVLFNMAFSTRDNALMYGGSLQLQRKESIHFTPPETTSISGAGLSSSSGSSTSTSTTTNIHKSNHNYDDSSHDISRNHGRNQSNFHTPAAIHRSHRPAPHTPIATFKPLTSNVNTPTSPASSSSSSSASGYSEWIGQMSIGFETMKNKNPFFDRFKEGITTFGEAVGQKLNSPNAKEEYLNSTENLADRLVSSSPEAGTVPLSDSSTSTSTSSSNRSHNGHGNHLIIPPVHKISMDLHVVYGLAFLSQIPCVNALRGPLSQLAQDQTYLQQLYQKFHERKSPPSSTAPSNSNWIEETLLMTYDRVENQHDSLRPLRLAYHQYLSHLSTRIPSVMRWGGAHDMDPRMILFTLTPRNFVTILIAFLLEYKIAIVSSKITALTVMGELLKSIIAPLKWSHVYVPLIPKQFNNDILQCPTPFFVGIQREFFDATTIPHDVILLDLDSDACRITSDLANGLYAGRFLAEALEKVLRPSLVLCDTIGSSLEVDSNLMIPDVLRLCKLFIADMLIGTEECCTYAVDHNELVVLFDEAMFSFYKMKRSKYDSSHPSSYPSSGHSSSSSGSGCGSGSGPSSLFPYDKGFLEQFMRTQCFSLCVVGNILKKLDPNSRPPSRPSSPFVSIPSPSPTVENSTLPSTPVQYS